MRYFVRLACALLAGGMVWGLGAQTGVGQPPDWTQLTTVDAVYERYPSEVEDLLDNLNLEAPELKDVRTAVREKKTVQATRALLDHYRTAETAQWLRDYSSEAEGEEYLARQILQGEYRFKGAPDSIPRKENGGLDWTHQGPDDDQEWAFVLNRHYHIEKLLEAYLATGTAAYARRLDRDLRDWIVHSRPYPAEKQRGPIWRGLEVAFRVERWSKAFFVLQHDDHLQPGTRLLMLMSLRDHAHYLRNYHSDRNWVTMELSALGLLAAAWPEYTASSAWMAYATQTLEAELDRQVYPDGAQKELSTQYHWIALANFEQLYDVRRKSAHSVPQSYGTHLTRMYQYLAAVVRPNGTGPLNNDGDLRAFGEELSAAADNYEQPEWRYIATGGQEGERPERGLSRVFPWAGQLVSRSGWTSGSQWSFFDMGPGGLAHQHNDKLHLSVRASGQDLLVDSGRFAYSGAVARRFRASYARHSRGHNVVLIDGRGQAQGPKEAEFPVPISRAFTTTRYDFARGTVDDFEGVRGAVEHKRAVLYLREQAWVVVDRVTTDRPRTVKTFWHFHPDCTVVQEDASVRTTDDRTGNVRVQASDESWTVDLVQGQLQPHPQGWYSPDYNQYTEATTAVARRQIEETTTFVWLIVPGRKEVPTSRVSLESTTPAGVQIQFRIGVHDWWASIPLTGERGPHLISQSLE
jgi:hypothetical protein